MKNTPGDNSRFQVAEALYRRARHRVLSALAVGATTAFANRQGRLTLPVIRGLARGLRFSVDLRSERGYVLGLYDRDMVARLPSLCSEGWTVWDCGTYLGFYTALFATLVGRSGTVVAIEPDPRSLERTRQNVALNGLRNVEFVQAAVAAPRRTSTSC